jgi:hypothetical protein
MLNDDVVTEILQHCDSKSIAAFMSINKYTKTTPRYRKHYTSQILDLQVNDRLTDKINNYKVVMISKKYGVLQIVDIYGKPLSDELIYVSIFNTKKYDKNEKNNLIWATFHYDPVNLIRITAKLNYGIIKHKYGPYIKNVDSIYLTYKTHEQSAFNTDDQNQPELNMLVTVDYKWRVYEYLITNIYNNHKSMSMTYIGEDIVTKRTLNAHCNQHDRWIVDNAKYTILFIGGYK